MSDPVRAIADAVLYEGYVLWPYRRSALKNQRRWTFGGVYPRGHSEGREDDPWVIRAEVLHEGGGDVDVRVRFLQVVQRQVWVDGAQVDEAVVDGERHLAWDEAVEREVGPGPIAIPAGRAEAAPLVRVSEALEGAVEVSRRTVSDGLERVSVRVENTTPWAGGPREDVLRRTFCSTHAVLRAASGRFLSGTDPRAGAACVSEGVWPVLIDDRCVLASPIILEDHPRIAPESPGDLFDGGEIDQLLVLNILALTDEEKAEMRASDPRAREILERTEALTPQQMLALHGAVRSR